jgi:hypothetical protein
MPQLIVSIFERSSGITDILEVALLLAVPNIVA